MILHSFHLKVHNFQVVVLLTVAVSISEGKIYNASVATLFGSEYTAPPAIVVKGIGNGNGGAVIEAKITIDTPAVRMGVAVDSDWYYTVNHSNSI
jgi:hypothetical protein